ncbi:hypothetical protein [Cellulomonas shaoxiangyii]|uniref:Uncharacterized protein n=1 Tax=Cellulomonas shaoxiangyii TaxID=2566013 RepID=A0A4P7SKI6_9CELL|nr:hypothetical protein [Cellulomonas shaoxiangyii]QCB93053.1 hypothetical protein E5225_05260 [Cellulomonas shaoxiangyii]TGY84678.1 hypothetical protein E5226_10105 [Cellulomonas shaoxiangyii]
MGTRRPGRATAALPAAAALLLAGCAAPALSPGQEQAREHLLELLSTTRMASYSPDIETFARAAGGALPVLVGIDPAAAGGDVLGTLTFAVTLPPPPEDVGGFPVVPRPPDPDPGPHCFEVLVDRHGKVGEWGSTEGVSLVDCPADLDPVVPPPSDDPVAAPDVREAAWRVLGELPVAGEPDPADVDDRITALLAPPAADGPPLADVLVHVDGTDVGVASGDEDDCVLVARIDGTVQDVHVTPVQLQPGEAGCTSGTALAGLRPPH